MRILNLPVEDSVADNYNNASQKEKSKINSVVNMLLAKMFNKDKGSLITTIDAISAQAEKNGLTIDKLGELMDWDDDTMKNLFGNDHARANA